MFRYTKSIQKLSLAYFRRNLQSDQTVQNFEKVYVFPDIKFISLFNRLKVYHLAGTAVAAPACGMLETLSAIPSGSTLVASYIGITGAVLFSLPSLLTKNIIGFIYVSEDNKTIKISYVDFWGRRKDKIIPADDWTPLNDMAPRNFDPLFLSPKLPNGTQLRMFVKIGAKVLNQQKMGQVIE